MEELIFGKSNLPNSLENGSGWTETQYEQLKNQILAYKFLVRNMPVPSEVLEKIRTYEISEWERMREKNMHQIQEAYEKRFKDHDLTMKELAVYFKKRMKESETIPRLWVDRNYGEDIEYNIDSEIEARKQKLSAYLSHIKISEKSEENEILQNIQTELKLLKIYSLQKKMRKEVLFNFVNDFEKQNSVYYSDMLFQKTLLDRRFYKRQITPLNKKDQKMNDRFEIQLKNGYDMRKKEKHREYLNQIIQHHKEFTDFHKNKRQVLKKRVQQAKQYLENIEKKDQQERERKERERIQLLKQNNIEGYLKLINEAKDARLVEFMNQTDVFLKEIENKISVQKDITQHIMQNQHEMLNPSEDMQVDENESEFMEDGQPRERKSLIHIEEEKDEKEREKVSNSKNYYLKAHSLLEEIKQQPKMLKFGQLKPYQIIGLQWLVSLYVNNLNGILADEMGLGKTIQTISLICYLIEKKSNQGPFLIVVPLSTISNWVLEFNKWAPDVKMVVYKGPPNHRRQLAYQLKNEKNKFNVVLTTYEYIMKDKFYLNKVTWQYIIVDEGHRMKNSKSKFTQTLGTQFTSVYRVLLTGTPLQNNLSELWALLNFLLPKIFNSCEDFEKWFNQPFNNKLSAEKNTDLNEEQQLLIINRLHTVLRPFLLRREKKDVEKELPNKVEYVIKVELSAWQKIVYDQIKNKGMLAQDPSTGKIGSKALMNTMMQLRKICNHPYLFVDSNNDIYNHINDDIFKSSGKFELLDRMLPKVLSTGHKVLIFSQMTHLMDILQLFFDFKGYRHLRLDGNTKADDRGNQMEIFNEPNSPYKIFILSTRAGGLGLNLQAADTVIIFDSDWNPQMDIQAQDRAHRIGQKQEVKVFRFITQTAIEEEILSKAAYKKNLDDKIIRAGLYNVKFSEQERRNKLLDLLKNDKEEDEEEDEIPNDEQINEMLSRSEDEFKIFQQMDQERYEREKRDDRINEIVNYTKIDLSSVKHINYRLLQEYEIPDWIHIKPEVVKEEETMGKGMRQKSKVNYRLDNLFDESEFLENDSSKEDESRLSRRKRRSTTIQERSSKKRKIESNDSQNLEDEIEEEDEESGEEISEESKPQSKRSKKNGKTSNGNGRMKFQIKMSNFS